MGVPRLGPTCYQNKHFLRGAGPVGHKPRSLPWVHADADSGVCEPAEQQTLPVSPPLWNACASPSPPAFLLGELPSLPGRFLGLPDLRKEVVIVTIPPALTHQRCWGSASPPGGQCLARPSAAPVG